MCQIVENRIHSPEDALEAYETLVGLWPRLDQLKLKVMVPEVYHSLGNQSLTRRVVSYAYK